MFDRYYRPLLCLILLFAFVTRVVRLHVPERYIFDEVYHVVTDKLIAKGDVAAYEWWHSPPEPNTAIDWLHPPLAKYFQAGFIKLLGSSSFSWRLSSVIFGVGVIWATAGLSLELFKNKTVSLLSALLASLDGLLLTQSRIAMNDIHVTFFLLVGLWVYIKFRQKRHHHWLWLTGLLMGLAMGTKWSGLFGLATVLGLEAWRVINLLREGQRVSHLLQLKAVIRFLMALVVVPAVVYLLSYSHMFILGQNVNHLIGLHKQIWAYQTGLTATHTYQSRPWQWFLDLRPVWFHVDYTSPGKIANIYAFGNPALFWLGDLAVLGSLGYLARKSLKHKQLTTKDQMLLVTLCAYGMVWLPWQLSPRIMFFYHYTPAIPLLSTILAFWLHTWLQLGHKRVTTWKRQAAVTAIMAIAVVFIIWYPQWTAIPVGKEFANDFYFAIKSWK